MAHHAAGTVAAANEEAVRAWDTVLYERWKKNRKVFVGALDGITEELFERFPPPEGGRCIDIGCGFGETTQRLAELVGPEGFVLGTDSSPHFVEDARREAAEAGVENVEFEASDAQTADWDQIYDYAFSRMGTQFFAMPVQAMRAIRRALVPGGALRKICWRRKAESAMWAETEQVVQRFLSRPEEYDADTCGPGPFSLGNPETTRGILEAAGFDEIELHSRDFDYYLGQGHGRGARRDARDRTRRRADPPQRRPRGEPPRRHSRGTGRPLHRLAAARRLDREPSSGLVRDSQESRLAFSCAQGDSNSHGPNGPQGPQPCARTAQSVRRSQIRPSCPRG